MVRELAEELGLDITASCLVPFVRLTIGSARLVCRVTRLSAHKLGLAAGSRIFAVVKSVAIDGRSREASPTVLDNKPK